MSQSFYPDAAEHLLGGPFRAVGQRYFDLKSRQQVLRRALKSIPVTNPLHEVRDFRPPLSVSGQPSSVIVRAEHLQMNGVPVAFELDSKGRHRGYSIEELVEKLSDTERRRVSEEEALAHYGELMTRNGRIAKRLGKIALELRQVEKNLMSSVHQLSGTRFWVCLLADPLAALVTVSTTNRMREGKEFRSVLLAYRDRVLRVNGVQIECHGMDSGAAVVRTADLHEAVGQAKPTDMISLTFSREYWLAEVLREGVTVWQKEYGYHE